jgi:hypothetical protein
VIITAPADRELYRLELIACCRVIQLDADNFSSVVTGFSRVISVRTSPTCCKSQRTSTISEAVALRKHHQERHGDDAYARFPCVAVFSRAFSDDGVDSPEDVIANAQFADVAIYNIIVQGLRHEVDLMTIFL